MEKETRKQKHKRKKKIGNNTLLAIYSLLHIKKWNSIKNNTEKRREELRFIVYVLFSMVVTRETSQLDKSAFIVPFWLNK